LSLSFKLPHQNPTYIPLLSHTCYMSFPSHPPWMFVLLIRWAVKKFPEWWYYTVMVGHTATLT
jgi:hypothetical protein